MSSVSPTCPLLFFFFSWKNKPKRVQWKTEIHNLQEKICLQHNQHQLFDPDLVSSLLVRHLTQSPEALLYRGRFFLMAIKSVGKKLLFISNIGYSSPRSSCPVIFRFKRTDQLKSLVEVPNQSTCSNTNKKRHKEHYCLQCTEQA